MMLDAIAEAGLVGCSLEAALAGSGAPCVGITFDDGTLGQYELAAPALRARGMSATFFVTTDWVGKPGFMDWPQVGQLSEWGMSVQSHTKSHPHLSQLDREALHLELAESKAILDSRLGQDTVHLALPGGDAPRRGLRAVITEVGYRAVATSRWGQNPDRADALENGPWIKRCNVPRSLDRSLCRKILLGDRGLGLRQVSREATLNGLRAILGANRYARWRRRFLDKLAGGSSRVVDP
jgi:peptidoglycan/xylan/chitin deacetylase (PgdA/CDA1 family)